MRCEDCRYKGTEKCTAVMLSAKLGKPVNASACSKGEPKDTNK